MNIEIIIEYKDNSTETKQIKNIISQKIMDELEELKKKLNNVEVGKTISFIQFTVIN